MSYDKSKPSQFDGLIQQAADNHGVSYDLLRKLIYNESSFNPTAKSKTGPKGLAQMTTATARSLGLNAADPGVDDPNDDRYKPELSVNAAAKHLGSLVGKFDGDELKAALAYNQGEGDLGSKQLEAYAKGDFSGISEEGRGYMRKLLDVAKSPMAGQLEAFGGITPKGKGIPSDVAFEGIGKPSKVNGALPQSTGFEVKGKEQAEAATPFAKDFWSKHGTTLDEYDNRSTFFGFGNAAEAELANSTLGVAARAGRLDNGYDVFKDTITPTRWNSHTWSPEELERIRTEVKNPAYINVVTGGSPENIDELIKLANQNYEYDSKAAEAGVGAKLSAGVIGAGVDPLSWVPMAGGAAKGFKLINKALVVGAESATMNVASEGIRTSIAGGNADYANAALGGFVFGAGMSALSDGVSAALRKAKGTEAVNPFVGPMMRMEARETALNAGSTDLSRLPAEQVKLGNEHAGVAFGAHPSEPGAAVLADGSVLSAANPLNPRTQKEFSEINPERAAKGVTLGGFTEIGLKTLRSEDTEIRRIATDLVRSPTGLESGAGGKFGATASDIHERLHSTDQRTYNELYDAVSTAMKDPEFSTGSAKMSREEVRNEVYKRAALAIERPELQKGLTKSERKVMDVLKQHFDTKRELMETPSIFGNEKAVSIFPGSRHKGTYVPQVYDRTAKSLMIQRYGAEGLQEAISRSWMTSYSARPEVKARVDDFIMSERGLKSAAEVTPEMVQKYAKDKAYGISHTDQFTASSAIEDNIDGMAGIGNNSFLEARNMFDSDMPITLPDGNQFSVNDLRDFDMSRVMPAYDRRVNGDIAIMGGAGKTINELKAELDALTKKAEGNGKMRGEVKALQDTIKILTGRQRRNTDGAFETAIRSLNDLGFFAKNAYMGAQNITEIAGMLAKGNVSAVMHGMPVVRDLITRKRPVSGTELKELHAALFGKELDDLIRPKRADIISRMREASDTSAAMANVVGTIKYGTQELAARSPWTKMLNGTSNYIIDAARQGMLGDVISATLGNRGTRWADAGFLKSAAISPEQFKGIQSLIREHLTKDASGQFSVKDKKAFSMDPRAMDLWRLADKVADETVLRPHKVSSQDSKAFGAGVRMAMQFKTFTIKSLNGKFVRSFYEATKNNRAIDMALTHAAALALSGGYFAMQAHVKAAALPKEQQKAYLDRAMNPSMLAYAALSRSSHIGAPLSVVNLIAAPLGFDQAKMVRSTILPKEEQKVDRNKPVTARQVTGDLMGGIAEQIPALGWIGNAGATIKNATGVLTAPNKATEQDYMTGLMNSSKELVPNDPITQQLLLKMYEAQGINLREAPRPQ